MSEIFFSAISTQRGSVGSSRPRTNFSADDISIVERPVESEIKNVALPGIIRRGQVSPFCEDLHQVVVFKEQARAFDLCVEENIHEGKCGGFEYILIIELLDCRVITGGVIRRFPVDVYSCMHVQISVEKNIRVGQLGCRE